MQGLRSKSLLALIFVGVGTGGCAMWGGEETDQAATALPSFSAMDADNSGTLARDEVTNETVLSNWDNIDTNNDNVIDSSEFSAFEQQM